MKLNSRAFAVSAVIYSLIVLFLMILLLILIMLSSRKVIIDKQKTDIINSINGTMSEFNIYKETILNGAYPELYHGLIPVVISSDGTVKKADTSKMWYSYENKVWANAVILKDSSIGYENNDIIPESNIKQYYVWIPRYKYQLWDVNGDGLFPNGTSNPSAINIVFEDKNEVLSNGKRNNEWLTHPAFTSFDINGIWVGKFETSYDETTYTDSSMFLTTNPNFDQALNASNIIIKPNVRSLTNKNLSEFYTLGNTINSNFNSHMMKNTEWGAVSYLTYSLYGKCSTSSCDEVYINNVNTGYLGSTQQFSSQLEYSSTITGCSGNSQSESYDSNIGECLNKYNSSIGVLASTTGNISGIYDMNGGTAEYVMSLLEYTDDDVISGKNQLYNSGFNGIYGCPTCDDQTELSKSDGIDLPSDMKYFDLYKPNSMILGDNTLYEYQNSQLGDALKEVTNKETVSSGLWFDDYTSFLTYTNPCISRGGVYNNENSAGVFNATSTNCSAQSQISFRIVLSYMS